MTVLAIGSEAGAGSFVSARHLWEGEIKRAGDTQRKIMTVPGHPLGLQLVEDDLSLSLSLF